MPADPKAFELLLETEIGNTDFAEEAGDAKAMFSHIVDGSDGRRILAHDGSLSQRC